MASSATSGLSPRAETGTATLPRPSGSRSRISSRRRWPIWRSSRTSGAAATLVVLLGLAAVAPATGPGILVATGDVAPTSAVVWARGVRPGTLDVLYSVINAAAPPARRPLAVTADRDLTGTLTLTGLLPATRYAVRVSQGEARAEAEFVTAPPPDAPARVTFLWSGDLGGGGYCRPQEGGYRIFRPMLERRADFFLFVGDTIYADVPCDKPGVVPGAEFRARTLAQYRARHRYQREDPPLQALLRATSVYAIRDDHEVRNDFSGPHDGLMPTGRRAMLDYWPIASPAEEPTRLYRRFRAHHVKNLVFVAADVHHAEVIRHQPTSEWSFHELVAGPLSATLGRPRPLDVTLNPRSLFARGGVFNFGEVLVEAAHLTVRLVDDGGAVMFTHVIAPD